MNQSVIQCLYHKMQDLTQACVLEITACLMNPHLCVAEMAAHYLEYATATLHEIHESCKQLQQYARVPKIQAFCTNEHASWQLFTQTWKAKMTTRMTSIVASSLTPPPTIVAATAPIHVVMAPIPIATAPLA